MSFLFNSIIIWTLPVLSCSYLLTYLLISIFLIAGKIVIAGDNWLTVFFNSSLYRYL